MRVRWSRSITSSTFVWIPFPTISEPRNFMAIYRSPSGSHPNNRRRPRNSFCSPPVALRVRLRCRGRYRYWYVRRQRRYALSRWLCCRWRRRRRVRWGQLDLINRDRNGRSFSRKTLSLCPPFRPCYGTPIGPIYPMYMLVCQFVSFISVFGTAPKPMSLTPRRTLTFLATVLCLSTSPTLGKFSRV